MSTPRGAVTAVRAIGKALSGLSRRSLSLLERLIPVRAARRIGTFWDEGAEDSRPARRAGRPGGEKADGD